MAELELSQKIEKVLISGDLRDLTAEERLTYYKSVCESIGLNPLTQPLDYIVLNGKLRLYAKKDATDQLRRLYDISVEDLKHDFREQIGLYIVTASGQNKSNRSDMSTGAVNIKGLSGEALANAIMKAETKAKRRLTLSLCGLGMLDETEIESAQDVHHPASVTPAPVLPSVPKVDQTPAEGKQEPRPGEVINAVPQNPEPVITTGKVSPSEPVSTNAENPAPAEKKRTRKPKESPVNGQPVPEAGITDEELAQIGTPAPPPPPDTKQEAEEFVGSLDPTPTDEEIKAFTVRIRALVQKGIKADLIRDRILELAKVTEYKQAPKRYWEQAISEKETPPSEVKTTDPF